LKPVVDTDGTVVNILKYFCTDWIAKFCKFHNLTDSLKD
jgi:hypothetical protein